MMPSLFHQRLAACGACPRLLYVPQYMGRCDTLTTTARKPWLFRQPTERRLEGLQIVGTSRRALSSSAHACPCKYSDGGQGSLHRRWVGPACAFFAIGPDTGRLLSSCAHAMMGTSEHQSSLLMKPSKRRRGNKLELTAQTPGGHRIPGRSAVSPSEGGTHSERYKTATVGNTRFSVSARRNSCQGIKMIRVFSFFFPST